MELPVEDLEKSSLYAASTEDDTGDELRIQQLSIRGFLQARAAENDVFFCQTQDWGEEKNYVHTIDAEGKTSTVSGALPPSKFVVAICLSPQGTRALLYLRYDKKNCVEVYALPEWKVINCISLKDYFPNTIVCMDEESFVACNHEHLYEFTLALVGGGAIATQQLTRSKPRAFHNKIFARCDSKTLICGEAEWHKCDPQSLTVVRKKSDGWNDFGTLPLSKNEASQATILAAAYGLCMVRVADNEVRLYQIGDTGISLYAQSLALDNWVCGDIDCSKTEWVLKSVAEPVDGESRKWLSRASLEWGVYLHKKAPMGKTLCSRVVPGRVFFCDMYGDICLLDCAKKSDA